MNTPITTLGLLSENQAFEDYMPAVTAALKAGGVLMTIFGEGNSPSLGLQVKQDGTAVTRADFASNEILMSAIGVAYPGDLVLSEEAPPIAMSNPNERLWIIDPLDGTQRFIDGHDDFGVLVGLYQSGHPLFGCMFFPARTQLVLAARGLGAYCNGSDISVSSCSVPREQSIYVRYLEIPTNDLAVPHQLDSGDALYKVACGELDGAIIHLSKHREWDLAAPICVIEEAGGKVSDENGDPFQLGIESVEDRFFIASNGLVHERLLHEVALYKPHS
jgi:fructose-1,6-bisphosphatase/inositol monophosphatase family enzyme